MFIVEYHQRNARSDARQMYIGETRRNVYTRMAEHAKTSGTNITAVGQHLADNPGHSANTANPDVLASSRYNFKRKIKESNP